MIVATYSVHDGEPRVHRTVLRPAKWMVHVYATDGTEKLARQIHNRQPCMLSELMDQAKETVNEMIDQLPAYTDAGFTVVRLR